VTDVSHLCWSGWTQISGALRIFLAAAQQEGYIFSRQVKPIASNSFPSLALFPSPEKIQPPPRLKSDRDRSPAIANMRPIALSVAVVDRLLGPGLVSVGVPVRLVR
jgi:hypothetical protein